MKLLLILIVAIFMVGCNSPIIHSNEINATFRGGAEPNQWRIGIQPGFAVMGDSRGASGGTFDMLPNTCYNFSISGSTLQSTLDNMHRLDSNQVKFIFISTGINDALFSDVVTFRNNLQMVANYAAQFGISCMILDQAISTSYNNPTFEAFKSVMKSIPNAGYLPIAYVDSDFIDGQCHLNGSGYKKMATKIYWAMRGVY